MPTTRTRQPRPPSYARFERNQKEGFEAIRVEVKDQIEATRREFIQQIEAVRKENEARFELLNLNGSAAALRELGKATPPLRNLAERADTLLLLADAAPSLLSAEMTDIRGEALEHRLLIQRFMRLLPGLLQQLDTRAEEDVFNAGLKKRLKQNLNPLKPVGVLLWVAVSGFLLAAGAGVYHIFFH